MHNLAFAYQNAGQLADALRLAREVLDKYRGQHPSQPLSVAAALCLMGNVLTGLDRATEAEPLLREGLALQEKHGAGHWVTANTRIVLGVSLTKQQKFADAELLLLQGYQGLTQAKGTPPERLQQALERLVQLYDAWDRKDKAEEWRKKLEAAKKSVKP
jgi:tetratricopeptide (TPR) repeat protein